jgi:uncharacterized Zn finger protein (UPF0148 family)
MTQPTAAACPVCGTSWTADIGVCPQCQDAATADLTSQLERAQAEAKFQDEQRRLATSVASTIADLDEEAPALRQMLASERGRRRGVEAHADRTLFALADAGHDVGTYERMPDAVKALVAQRDAARADGVCCDLHNRNCEPPGELCCAGCTEAGHPEHADGRACIAPDLSRKSPGRDPFGGPCHLCAAESAGGER